jgi:hypothetical protein
MGQVHDDAHKKLFLNHIENAIFGYNCFLEENYLKEAYQLLCNTLELLETSRNYYHYTDPFDFDQLSSVRKSLQEKLDFTEYQMIIRPLLERSMKTEKNGEALGMRYVKDLDDSQILTLSQSALKAFSLPADRLVNIENEMKAYRLFYNRCTDNSLDILQLSSPSETKEDQYKYPVRFVLRRKNTKIETLPSGNMEELLKTYGL